MKGELLALAALAIFSVNIILTRLASARLALDAGFVLMVGVNIVFAAVLFVVQLMFRNDPFFWQWESVGLFALAGVFSTYLGRWFMLESITRLGPARASGYQVSSPLFTVIFAWLFLGERLSATSIAAMAVTGAGLLILIFSRTGFASALGREAGGGRPVRDRVAAMMRSGALIGAGASAAYSISNVLRGAAIRQWDETIAGALIGAIAGITLQFIFGSSPAAIGRALASGDHRGIALFTLTGALTITAQMCTIAAMAHAPVAVVSLITLCTPVLVFPLSYFVLRNDERINARAIAGALMVLAGIAAIILR